jgi:hypothetical protein
MNLREIVKYDPETGCFSWLISGKGIRQGYPCGAITTQGYHRIKIQQREYLAHRLAWFFMTGSWPDGEIDHINMDKADNRWINLRDATTKQNQYNRTAPSNNTSGFKGVTWNKKCKKWQSSIGYEGRYVYLGLFDCPAAAHFAYVIGADKHHGMFARSS